MKNRNVSRRGFLGKVTALGVGTMILPRGGLSQAALQKLPTSLKGRKVLMVWGGWEGHQPRQCIDIYEPWLRSLSADVTVSNTLDAYLDEKLMDQTDLIIQVWTMGTISGDQERALLNAVKRGVGLAGWHGGLGDSFRQNTEYQFMVGGQWVAHPGGIIDYNVHITDHNDPVTQGIMNFKMHSEQYYMQVDPNVKVLATTTFTGDHAAWINGCVVPVIWKKTYGRGRIFYSSLGHQARDFDVPEALETVKRGILWASESKYRPPEEWIHPVYQGKSKI